MDSRKIRSYRDLIVWQRAQEARIIKGQIIRSSISVPANIAEGFGGNKGKVFQNSLTIARRKAGETDYWILLNFENGYLDEALHKELEDGYQEVRAMLSSMIYKME